MSAKFYKQFNLKLNRNQHIPLFSANGGKITVLGSANVIFSTSTCNVPSTVLVATDMTHPVLLSWHDMIKLVIIPASFPWPTAASVESSVREQILSAFPSVFSDELGVKPMNSEKVHLHLKDNAIPYRVSAARQIPLRFKEPAEACVKELLNKGVITPCHEPSEWCSPGFFVVKPDGKNVRMVTDFTKLNSYVQRPVHPFTCVSEILQSIPSDAKVFAKMDAVNGYFQIELDEESSRKTTFLLPSGRYRYLRIPQGLNASSDEWCRRSDAILDGLPWAKKIVDDVLVWASNMQELQSRITTVANNCKRLNITLSKKKFQVGSQIPFAGYIVGANGIQPDPDRVSAVKQFAKPKNVTDVKSILGMA